MNARLRLTLALWTALVVAGGALAGEIGYCDSLCCPEPCAPDQCAGCALSGPVSDDAGLLPAPAAALPPAPPVASVLAVTTAEPISPSVAPAPAPSRPPVLRI
jgi:hypothetical protein